MHRLAGIMASDHEGCGASACGALAVERTPEDLRVHRKGCRSLHVYISGYCGMETGSQTCLRLPAAEQCLLP